MRDKVRDKGNISERPPHKVATPVGNKMVNKKPISQHAPHTNQYGRQIGKHSGRQNERQSGRQRKHLGPGSTYKSIWRRHLDTGSAYKSIWDTKWRKKSGTKWETKWETKKNFSEQAPHRNKYGRNSRHNTIAPNTSIHGSIILKLPNPSTPA